MVVGIWHHLLSRHASGDGMMTVLILLASCCTIGSVWANSGKPLPVSTSPLFVLVIGLVGLFIPRAFFTDLIFGPLLVVGYTFHFASYIRGIIGDRTSEEDRAAVVEGRDLYSRIVIGLFCFDAFLLFNRV